MALIGTIRKNGWILIVLMILALGGFILMDIVSNAQRYSAGDINSLGKVNGKEIKRSDFERYQSLIYTDPKSDPYQVRQQVWTYFMEQALVSKEAEALGLGVSKEELNDLEFGENLSPLIAERVKGPDGQPNRAQLANIKSAIEQRANEKPDQNTYRFWLYWAEQENEVIKERLQEKITNMVIKSMYTPAWQAEMTYRDNNQRLDFLYVRIPYDKIKDEEAKLTDADYEAFIKDNPRLYDQPEETRVVSFVALDVLPTADDSLASRRALAGMIAGLKSATNDSVYVASQNGTYENKYNKKDALPAAVADSLLSLPVGTVIGPYQDQGAWKAAKIIDRKVIPDSIKARHILRRNDSPDAEKKIDSLLAILNAKTVSFDSLARANSQDPGSGLKGGDLGWFAEGQMVPEFNAVCFYYGVPGKYYKVQTQFGWHLIELTGKKSIKNEVGVKAAYLNQPIEPSTQTQQRVKDRALAMVQQIKTLSELNSAAGQQNLSVENSQPLKPNDYAVGGSLPPGDDARDIVRWAFDSKSKPDAVSKDVFSFRAPGGGYYDAKYVVAGLKSIAPAGKTTIATLKSNPRAEQEVKNRKKAEIIKGKLQNAGDLSAVASQWGVTVDTAKGSSMMQPFLPKGGSEPRVVGTAFSLGKDAVSKPIGGGSGVYIVKPIMDKPEMQLPPDLTMFRRQVTSQAISSIRMNLMNTMKKQADTKDNRSRFF